MDDTLILTLGPPFDPWQKQLFDSYQKYRLSARPMKAGNWPEFEVQVVEQLFSRGEDGRSAMDELFSRLMGEPIGIENHTFGMSLHQGQHLGMIAISKGDVRADPFGEIPWPPEQFVCQDAALSLMFLLKRRKIGAFNVCLDLDAEAV